MCAVPAVFHLGGFGRRIQPDRGPLGRGCGIGPGIGLGGRLSRNLVRVHLEDAQLAIAGGGDRFLAQRAFRIAWPDLSRGHQLARKLNQVGGQRHCRPRWLLENRRTTERDLFIERPGFSLVALFVMVGAAGVGGAARCSEIDLRGAGSVFV